MFKRLTAGAMLGLLLGCATGPVRQEDIGESAWAAQCRLPAMSVADASAPGPASTGGLAHAGAEGPSAFAAEGWHHRRFPGKTPANFSAARKAGRDALAVEAAASASMLRHRLQVPGDALGTLRFSWLVPALIDSADMRSRDADDSPARIVLAFEGDRARFSQRDAMLSELSLLLTGEPLPYATLMYVWCNRCTPGEVIHNPRTSRIRKIAVQSGAAGLGQWRDHERDIRADFERAFGEPPGPLTGVALMTDTDNTRAKARAWYGPIHLSSKVPIAAP